MAASEALSLVALTLADVAGGMVLSAHAGWNQTADDWAFFIQQGHALGFKTASGVLIATAAALAYGGGFGWVSMVLVSPDWRHRGLASLLVDTCVKRLQALHVRPVLDATPAGQPVYRHLGFNVGFEFERWEGTVAPDISAPSRGIDASAVDAPDPGAIRSADRSDLDAIAALDQVATGIGRRALLQDMLARPGTAAWIAADGSGFAMVRDGHRAKQLGPLAATDPAQAIALLRSALRDRSGALFLDVPMRWRELTTWLEQRGFARQRPFARMALGAAAPFACSDRSFALAGPEFG
jgi:GNAT superfamily N-acetyltransferase